MLNRYKWLVPVVFITLFAWVIVGIIMSVSGQLLFVMPGPPKKSEITVQTPKKQPAPISSYDVIKESKLLGSISKGPQGTLTGDDRDRPIAALGLLLKGTIAGSVIFSRAIIEDKGKQQIFKIGDSVSGANIIGIFRNKVILEMNGQEQMLVPEETTGKKGAKGGPSGPSVPTIPIGGMSEGGDMSSAMQNMEQFLGNARVVPYFKGGEPYGFRVTNVDNSSPLFGLGVRSGDVIKSVNGIPIKTPEDAMKLYQNMQNISSANVELERHGTTTSVNVPLK
jgi:general secretion pathway protein C